MFIFTKRRGAVCYNGDDEHVVYKNMIYSVNVVIYFQM